MRGSKLTLFLCAGRKLLVFSVNTENDLVLVETDLISAWGIELDLISAVGMKLVVVRVVEIDLLFVCWPKITCF